MDPLSILGAISAVMGVVDIGARLVSGGVSRYHEARETARDRDAIVADTANIKQRAQWLRSSLENDDIFKQVTARYQAELRILCETSIETTGEIVAHLARSPVPEQASFLASFRGLSSSGQTKRLRLKLQDLQKRSSEVLIFILNDKQSRSMSTILKLSQDVSSLRLHVETSIDSLRMDVLAAAEKSKVAVVPGLHQSYQLLEQLRSEIETRKTQVDVIKSLQYGNMRQRYHGVPCAMQNTFEWIFKDATDRDDSCVQFTPWLRTKGGIYWISGRPGSGKSTLMKFLHDDSRTKNNLTEWAGTKRLVLASHFFWIHGGPMQRSQEGLLSGLLENILTQCPELVSTVSEVWGGSSPWPFDELLAACTRLTAGQASLPVRFCFLIDALDEYEGDHNSVAAIVKTLSQTPDVKIVVSSREWNVFTYHFGNLDTGQKLTLQDYTKEDIKTYIRSTLESDQRFKDFEQAQKEKLNPDLYSNTESTSGTDTAAHGYSMSDLVQDICDFAQGVFLWVFLVCRELLKGLTNEDTMDFLKVRLYDLPRELDEYFRRMLESVDKVYYHRNTQILQVISNAHGPLPLDFFGYFEQEGNFSLQLEQGHRHQSQSVQTQENRLRAQGGDLIAFHHVPDLKGSPAEYGVTFLHRTVGDFLLRGEMKQFLLNRLREPFDPIIYLTNAIIASIKTLTPDNPKDKAWISYLLCAFLYYARLAEKQRCPIPIPVLDEMGTSFCKLSKIVRVEDHISEQYHLAYSDAWLLQLAVLAGLTSYVSSRLRTQPSLARVADRHVPLLELALQNNDAMLSLLTRDLFPQTDMEIVSLLLECGASPNQEWESKTVWHRFLRRVHEGHAQFGLDSTEFMIIIKALLDAGAAFNTQVITGTTTQGGGIGAGRSYLVKTAAEDILATVCPPDYVAQLRQEYDQPGFLWRTLRAVGL